MILILGSTHDDILYFESIMTEKKEDKIFFDYSVEFGRIFNQEVVLVYDIYTSYETALITNYIIEKYFVLLIFVVGKCVSLNEDLLPGQIAISKRVILGDVDQVKEASVRLGQIPHFPPNFKSEEEIMKLVATSLEKRSFSKYKLASFISANEILDTSEKIKHINKDGYFYGHNNNIVFDCTSGGVVLAAHVHKIPFVVVKAVERIIDHPQDTDNYIAVLQQYSAIGKAIVSCIGDISHNDVIKAGN